MSSSEFHHYNRDEFLAEFYPDPADKAAIAAGMEQLRAGQRAFRLAEMRRRLGITQAQVASRMGITQGRVSAIEHARPGSSLTRHRPGTRYLAAASNTTLRVGWLAADNTALRARMVRFARRAPKHHAIDAVFAYSDISEGKQISGSQRRLTALRSPAWMSHRGTRLSALVSQTHWPPSSGSLFRAVTALTVGVSGGAVSIVRTAPAVQTLESLMVGGAAWYGSAWCAKPAG